MIHHTVFDFVQIIPGGIYEMGTEQNLNHHIWMNIRVPSILMFTSMVLTHSHVEDVEFGARYLRYEQ